MLLNAYLLAKFRFDTAENERNFAKICTAPNATAATVAFGGDGRGEGRRRAGRGVRGVRERGARVVEGHGWQLRWH